jgi:cytochrome P450
VTTPGQPTTLDEVDFYDPATQEDWYPTYDLLREQAPVWPMPGTGTFVLTRHEDIAHVLRRTDIFRRGAGAATPSSGAASTTRAIYEAKGWPRRTVLGSNPPEHRRYREIVDPFFTVAGAERRRPLIEGIVDDLIGAMAPRGGCEFVRDFATPLPVRVITEIMGFRAADIGKLKVYSEAWVLPFRGGLTHDEEVYAGEKGVEFQHHIHATMQEKKAAPDESVISYLVNEARFDGRPLTDAEIINMVDHLYIGGNETTTFALTSGLWLLLGHPEAHAAVLADRSRIRNFVEESLRCESPTMGMVRTAAVDTEIGGVPIPAGSSLHLRYAAANRDPAVFECPARFDVDRPNTQRHMAFSVGETHCTGAGLSRVEQHIAFDALLERLPNLRFTPERNDFTHHPNVTLRAMKELWISWDRPA